jgi:hypothetical protein
MIRLGSYSNIFEYLKRCHSPPDHRSETLGASNFVSGTATADLISPSRPIALHRWPIGH